MKSISPRIKIFARAHNLKSANNLIKSGVKFAMPEIIESSFMLGENLMFGLGVSRSKINTLVDDMRANNYANVKQRVNVTETK